MLIIDDDDTIAAHAAHFFDDSTWNVEVVREASAARQRASGGEYEALILDVALTGASIREGLGLLAQLRVLQPAARIVVLTAFGSDEVAAAALGLGADRVLHKPLSFREIKAEIGILFASEG